MGVEVVAQQLERASHALGQLSPDGQTQAESLPGSPLAPAEALEDEVPLLGWNAGPLILDGEGDVAPVVAVATVATGHRYPHHAGRG